MAMTEDTLRLELARLMEAGDEKALEAFVVEHFTEFPEATRKDILLAFTSETLEKEAGRAKIVELQERGMGALNKLATLKDDLSARLESNQRPSA